MKIVEYKIVQWSYIHELENEVNALLKLGWQPLGAAALTISTYRMYYMQTLVQYETN